MELMTITAAAAYVSLSRTSIYKLIERGDLHVVRLLPDAPRIHRQDLDALIAARTGADAAPGAAQGGRHRAGQPRTTYGHDDEQKPLELCSRGFRRQEGLH